MVSKETITGSGDGKGEYEQLVGELTESGVLADGAKIAKEGFDLLQQMPGRQQAIHMIASVDAKNILTDKADALIADLIARTKFINRRERVIFIDYWQWLKEFEVPRDRALLILASARSEGGESTDQLIQAVTSITYKGYNYGHGRGTTREQLDKRKIS